MKVVAFLETGSPRFNPPKRLLDLLQKDFKEVDFVFPENTRELLKEIIDADVFFAWVITEQMLQTAARLKWFHTVGVQNGYLFPERVFQEIPVTCSKGAFADQVSQNLMGLILSLGRKISVAPAPEDLPDSLESVDLKSLSDAVLGIVGLGANGNMLAKRAKVFGAKIVAIKRTPAEKPEYIDELWAPDRLFELLQISDIVAVTAPLTKETSGMFTARAFSKMKKGSLLVSSSRPQLFDEKALIEAMKSGVISGLGLDDMWPLDSKVMSFPQVAVVAHIRPDEPGSWDRLFDIFRENLILFMDSKPLKNLVDKDFLY